MSQKRGFELLKIYAPAFRSPLKTVGIIILGTLFFFSILLFFWWFDSLVWYGPLISQLLAAIIFATFSYIRMKNVENYRTKYGSLAYQHFFFHFIIAMLVIGNCCIVHPLLVAGSPVLPFEVALVAGIAFITLRFLLEWHIRRAGFDEIGHGLEIYMMFPEEGRRINTEIYSVIRHPMYTGDLCLALGFALLRNNLLAISVALIAVLPYLFEAKLEDRNLITRFGKEHRDYIKATPAFFPHLRNVGKFLKILFSKQKIQADS